MTSDDLSAARQAIARAWFADEDEAAQSLIAMAAPTPAQDNKIEQIARSLVAAVRAGRRKGGIDAFMHEFELSSREGVVLMCLAEALLRIPDANTADLLIQEKLSTADWASHLGSSQSAFVNASTLALMLTGRVVRLGRDDVRGDILRAILGRLVARSGEPVIRQAITRAMRILGSQFVMGRSIKEALTRAGDEDRYSFDMLGEGARTRVDAERYADAYAHAITTIGQASAGRGPIDGPGVSVKLSALHPRYELAQQDRVWAELMPRLLDLARLARDQGIGFTIDAEEANRLDLSLDLFAKLAADPALGQWDGLGLAVQAYQKRAIHVVDWLAVLARGTSRRLMVRLVKGAYWDTEIKQAQIDGHSAYPVFTRKAATDVSYLACVGKLLADERAFYPQFATHNAHSVAAILAAARPGQALEFQRLHGMGEPLYAEVARSGDEPPPCRIYAPVGSHEDLLAYLARRLLENGANTSFVNRIIDENAPIEDLIADPCGSLRSYPSIPHPRIPLPRDIFGGDRVNSIGMELADRVATEPLLTAMAQATATANWTAAPLIDGVAATGPTQPVLDPTDNRRIAGQVTTASAAHILSAIDHAVAAAPVWDRVPAAERAACLERAADLFEQRLPAFMAMAIREAGKTIPDARAELREAIDFLRYYAGRARDDFSQPMALPGPTGELNEISLHGRGVFVCISPWNFPLAIFCGQVAAALAAGNAVVAKPAEQTPLIACAAVLLLHEAGIPTAALSLLPGSGEVGSALIADPRIAGVAFTGSTATARLINRALAAKDGPIVPLIAETGGQNVMLVDSSALPEQVVDDVVASAFGSAGQRCSALRVLFVQEDIADSLLTMLTGAMAELTIGDPAFLATDIGPVIDQTALSMLQRHVARMEEQAKPLYQGQLAPATQHGTFMAPQVFEIENLSLLEDEVFGPILHVVRYATTEVDQVIADVNGTGYGLTMGVHSRIDATAQRFVQGIRAGNAYVNRNIIGAVVGVQPFGGEGLSGTGPKAGGPRYLHRFATERTRSVNTTAAGGNAALMSLLDSDTDPD